MKSLKLSLAAVTALYLVGCASKPITGMEKVSENRKAIEQTDEKLKEAQEKLADFRDNVQDLKASFQESERLGTSAKASESLERLSFKIEQAQIDLQELSQSNQIAAQDLDTRLKNAAEENNRVLTR